MKLCLSLLQLHLCIYINIRELHFFHIILCQWSFAGVRFMPLFMLKNNQNEWRLNKLQLDWTSVFERVQVSLSGEEG